jgi:hypothetical protein
MASAKLVRIAIAPVVLVLLVAGNWLALGDAQAHSTCSNAANNHCYAIAGWDVTGSPSGFLGDATNIRSNCMTLGSYSGSELQNEMWMSNNDNNNSWVEAGIKIGVHYNGTYSTTPTDFWADLRPGQAFADHFPGPYTLGNTIGVSLQKSSASSTSFNVYVDGYGATSAPNFSGTSQYISAGNETTTTTVHTFGSVSAMGYKNLTGSWINNWSGVSSGAVLIPPDGTLHSNWVTQYAWMQSGAGATC